MKKKAKAKKPVSITYLETKLKKVLYPLIKKRDGNTCISCGKRDLKGRDWAVGHYAKAELCNVIWRYSAFNLHSQCFYCNKWLRGNTIEYRKNLIKKIGEVKVLVIEENYKYHLHQNFDSRLYLKNMIDETKNNPDLYIKYL